MNWIQENKKLASIVGFMIIGAIGLGVWLSMAYSDYATARDEYAAATSQVAKLEGASLYPSAANVEVKKQKVAGYQEEVEKLRSVLLALQQPIKPLTETEFQVKLKERATFVRQKAEGAGMGLPPEFALGFDEYTVTLPKSSDLSAELNVHLDAMERLMMTLVESGVKSLDSLDRSRLPSESATTSIKGGNSSSAPKPAQGKPALPDLTKASEPVLDRYTIKLTFTTDQLPLQNVMNVLSNFSPKASPYFMVVRMLKLENAQSEGPLRDDVKRAKSQPAVVPTPAPVTPTVPGTSPKGSRVIEAIQAAPPDAVTVMGEELIKVYMELDYIRFRDGGSATVASAPAKK